MAPGRALRDTVPPMTPNPAAPTTIDEYIAAARPEVRPILEAIRATIRTAVPEAKETISYRMPTFVLDGVVLHFAAFRAHIGLYPPVQGDADLMARIQPYAGPEGNLRFPLDQPIPYELIAELATARARQNRERAAARRTRRSGRAGKAGERR